MVGRWSFPLGFWSRFRGELLVSGRETNSQDLLFIQKCLFLLQLLFCHPTLHLIEPMAKHHVADHQHWQEEHTVTPVCRWNLHKSSLFFPIKIIKNGPCKKEKDLSLDPVFSLYFLFFICSPPFEDLFFKVSSWDDFSHQDVRRGCQKGWRSKAFKSYEKKLVEATRYTPENEHGNKTSTMNEDVLVENPWIHDIGWRCISYWKMGDFPMSFVSSWGVYTLKNERMETDKNEVFLEDDALFSRGCFLMCFSYFVDFFASKKTFRIFDVHQNTFKKR